MLTGLEVHSKIADETFKEVVMRVYFREGDWLMRLATLTVNREEYFPLLRELRTVKNSGPTHYTLFGVHSEEEHDEIRSNAEFEYAGDGRKQKYYDRV